MENIKSIGDYTVTGIYDIECSLKRDKDSTESKQVTLRVHVNSIPLKDIVTKALSPVKISWQNGPGRNKFDSWKNRSVVDIDFKSPGTSVKTREESIEELKVAFMKAGLPKEQALELATKSVDNPEVLA